MKKLTTLIAILAALAMTGCSSVLVKDSKIDERTFKLSILEIVKIEAKTKGLVIGEVETKKKPVESSESND